MSEEDRIWLETLAGKRTGGDSTVAREAEGLRRAMLERSIDEEALARSVSDTRRAERLLERARRGGAMRRRAPVAWLAGWPGLLATAAVCVVAIGIGFQSAGRKSPGLDETVRSASPHAFVLTADDPSKLRDQIADELDAVGVTARMYEHLGREGIDAELPDPLPEPVRAVLARHGVPQPADGVLRIEVTESAP